ncbi:hypothetical protein LOK49_LG02G03169 [Camellia lanceoleosa]|uniref:Uncharacterized protein n=1 Tax=Camellia lanceoleosa TaxID=1840588 RepID=A0ACC0IJX1_9ERIC|nr:hypothetical protein LOK49_LG02G03169 [Camellia lanceoleosa]
MSSYKSEIPHDPAKVTTATDKSESEKPLDQDKAQKTDDPKKDDPPKDDAKKDAGIFAACLACLCCGFGAEGVVGAETL